MAPLLELIDAPHALPALERLQVLLIESDEVQALQVGGWLAERPEIQLTHCAAGGEVPRWLRDRRWDLIVADLDEVAPVQQPAAFMRLGGRGVPVLALTRQLGVGTVRIALQQQVDGLLPGPFTREGLLEEVFALVQAPRERERRERRVVLAIGAHPDDVEIGCGGTLLKQQAAGAEIAVLILSRGANGGDAQVRVEEARRAARLLDARLEIADLPDSFIPEGAATIALIEKMVRDVAPTHVYTHSLHDAHQDHRNVHLASVVAARHVPNLYCYQAPSSTPDFRPNLFVDIAEHMESKVAAIAAYRSQVARHAGLDSGHIVATARYWGRYAGYGLAEPMEIIRQCER